MRAITKHSFANRDWTVIRVFDAGNTGFNSEIWGDAEQLMQAFRRSAYSSVIFRLRDSAEFAAVGKRIEGDPRLALEAKRGPDSKDQSETTATFLRILGASLAVIFHGRHRAMITMYAAVANRLGEIGTLRAVGFGARHPDRLPGGALFLGSWAASPDSSSRRSSSSSRSPPPTGRPSPSWPFSSG